MSPGPVGGCCLSLTTDPALLLDFAAPVTRHPPPTTTEVFNGPRMPRWWPKRCGGVPCGVK